MFNFLLYDGFNQLKLLDRAQQLSTLSVEDYCGHIHITSLIPHEHVPVAAKKLLSRQMKWRRFAWGYRTPSGAPYVA